MITENGVAVYLRVSTGMQSVECQRPDIATLLHARGMSASHVYEEQASAAKRRPEFERMKLDAAAGKFQTLVIWALDRFGRSLTGNVNDLLALDRLGVKVVSVREPWMDTAGPVRELLVAIFSWVAQQERSRLIERTKAGIRAVRVRGKPWGRPSRALASPDDRQAVMDTWDAEGRPDGYKGLAAQLGGCSPTTARKLWLLAHPGEPHWHLGKPVNEPIAETPQTGLEV